MTKNGPVDRAVFCRTPMQLAGAHVERPAVDLDQLDVAVRPRQARKRNKAGRLLRRRCLSYPKNDARDPCPVTGSLRPPPLRRFVREGVLAVRVRSAKNRWLQDKDVRR